MGKIFGYLALGICGALGIVALCFTISMVLSIPTWLLWNWLMPTIFGITTISLIQAWGLTFLCGILFKSSVSKKED